MLEIKRGEVYLANNGSYGYKPVIILQDNVVNEADYMIAIKCARQPRIENQYHINVVATDINGVQSESVALCDHICTVKRYSIGRYIGRVGDDDMTKILNLVKQVIGF